MYLKKLSHALLCAGLLSMSAHALAETAPSAPAEAMPVKAMPVKAAAAPISEDKPATTEEAAAPTDYSNPGSWVKIQMSGTEEDLLILGSLSNMLQNMLDHSNPRQRNLRIRLDSSAAEAPHLLGISIEDMDMPEEDRMTKLFFYNPHDKQEFQKGIREYMEAYLGLGFGELPPVPELEKLVAQKQTNQNIEVSLEKPEELPDIPAQQAATDNTGEMPQKTP